MHKNTSRAAVLALVVLATGVAASKGDAGENCFTVVINGVDVTGLTSQTFEGCKVVFDDKGNVDITAPGYSIKKVEPGEKKPENSDTPPPSKKHYYMWTENQNGNLVGDEYSLIVNGKVVKEFQSSSQQVVEEITSYLKSGTNQVVVTAVKKDGYSPGSSSDYFRIVFGEGHEENSKAVIEKTLHKFTRKASEGEPGQSAYTLKAK